MGQARQPGLRGQRRSPLDPWLRVFDATHTFDLVAPDGSVIGADLLTQVTAANLHGEFATVVQTRDVL